MSGAPSEAEIQAQWAAAVDILETARNLIDGTMAGASGKFDTLIQALEGEYTPAGLTSAVANVRNLMSGIIDEGSALNFLTPIIYEYMNILGADASNGFGAGFQDLRNAFRALYDWFHDNSLTVESRAITYGSAARNAFGNGVCTRLTVDENGYNLEACHVEKKLIVCTSDQYTGTEKWAEAFTVLGEPRSYDALLRSAFGSGERGLATIVSAHGGTGAGASLLRNSSFQTWITSTSSFDGWTETTATGNIAQDTTNYYNAAPGTQTHASLKITGGGGTVTMKQTLANMRSKRLDIDKPYFARIMVNPTIGTASGGSVTIRLGSTSKTVTIASLSSGWNEVTLDLDENCWPRNFVEDPMDFEIEWSSSTSGYLLVDDVILTPWNLIDGTYWMIRTSNATPFAWQVDDKFTATDSGGAPATGKVQWWLFVAGLGYLPSSGTPTFADP